MRHKSRYGVLIYKKTAVAYLCHGFGFDEKVRAELQ